MDPKVSSSMAVERLVPALEPDEEYNVYAPLPDIIAAHENNAAVPIHLLPAEIFLDILFISVDFTTVEQPLVPQLRVLAQVCAYWFHSIRSNPRFWSLINLAEPEWVDTVLKKNPEGPLAVRCVSATPAADHVLEFLRLARQQAHRWETVTVTATLGIESVALLEVHAPILKYLDLRNYDYIDAVNIHLSAPALQYANFHYLHLPFNSNSLSGLRHLMIYTNSTVFPSLGQLVTVLRASPKLEWFGLEELYEQDRDMGTGFSGLGGPVLLPELQVIMLRLSNHNLISAWIDAPNCRLFSGSIPFDALTHSGSTAVKIGRIPIRTTHTITAHVRGEYHGLNIRSSKRHESELYCSQGNLEFQSVEISHIPDGVEPWRVAMEMLGIPAEECVESFAVVFGHVADTFSGDQIGIWHAASTFFFGFLGLSAGRVDSIRVRFICNIG